MYNIQDQQTFAAATYRTKKRTCQPCATMRAYQWTARVSRFGRVYVICRYFAHERVDSARKPRSRIHARGVCVREIMPCGSFSQNWNPRSVVLTKVLVRESFGRRRFQKHEGVRNMKSTVDPGFAVPVSVRKMKKVTPF